MTRTTRRTLAVAAALALGFPAFSGELSMPSARAEEPARPRPPAPAPPRGDNHDWDPVPFTEGEPGTISGRVLSPSGEALPEGLEIGFNGKLPEGSKRRNRNSEIAADGEFVIRDLLEGESYSLEVWAFGCSVLAKAGRIPSGSKDLVLTLKPGGTIRGVVLDAAGEPVGVGVQVSAVRTQRGWCGFVGPGGVSGARTRADGSFLLEYLGDTDFTVTSSRGDPRQPGEVAHAVLIPEGSTGVVLRLGPPIRSSREGAAILEPSPHRPAATAITGRLLSKAGTPLPEFFLLRATPSGGGKEQACYASPSGLFDTGTLAAGWWDLRAVAPSGLEVGTKKGVATGARDLEIPLDPFGSIGGRVFDRDGAPVGAGFVVDAEASERADASRPGGRSSALTRDDGSYLVEYLQEFAFTLKVRPPRRLLPWNEKWIPGPAPRGVPTGSTGIALHLVPSFSVSGTLLSDDGSPVSGVWMLARREEQLTGATDQTNPKGEFRFERLAAGKFRVSATIGKDEFDLGEHEAPAKDLVLRLPPR